MASWSLSRPAILDILETFLFNRKMKLNPKHWRCARLSENLKVLCVQQDHHPLQQGYLKSKKLCASITHVPRCPCCYFKWFSKIGKIHAYFEDDIHVLLLAVFLMPDNQGLPRKSKGSLFPPKWLNLRRFSEGFFCRKNVLEFFLEIHDQIRNNFF